MGSAQRITGNGPGHRTVRQEADSPPTEEAGYVTPERIDTPRKLARLSLDWLQRVATDPSTDLRRAGTVFSGVRASCQAISVGRGMGHDSEIG